MNTRKKSVVSFVRELMRRRKRTITQLAADLGVSHSTVSRWLSFKFTPDIDSCRRLAEYSGVSFDHILSIVGHLPTMSKMRSAEWPEFREYAQQKYPDVLNEDLIMMIEALIESKKGKRHAR